MTRLSQSFFVTQREAPNDAVALSHQLLLRGGYIRALGQTAGLYTYGPLLWRVIQKIERIIRAELDSIHAQECLLPQLHPAEIWKASGRWEVYRAEGLMFTLKDGTGEQAREYGLGPTHEEAVCDFVLGSLTTYRQLPFTLYQIQTKFRNERRPRFGLMRGREFIMKDAYSFHANEESLKATYRDMYGVYTRIFERTGLNFRAVEADSGAIGGSGSHEFMALAEIGEDTILYCDEANYAANVEKARSLPPAAVPAANPGPREKVATPGLKTGQQQAERLGIDVTQIVKNILYLALKDGQEFPVLVSIRGDRQVNETKVKNQVQALDLRLPSETEVLALTGVPTGFLGPNALKTGVHLVDPTAAELRFFSTGCNEPDYHWTAANWHEDGLTLGRVVDVDMAQAGDRCHLLPTAFLKSAKGIELGHIFQLGTKYSQPMGVTFADETGVPQPVLMGCYGIGVSRLAAALVEQSHDADGIIWPVAIAPYHVHLVIPNLNDQDQQRFAQKVYRDLRDFGVEVLLDDRDERAGVKFKDADLIGLPYRLTVGRDLKAGFVEVRDRRTGKTEKAPVNEVVSYLVGLIREGGADTVPPLG
ncbi:proline--tRNA ligase [Candidatus Cyanaurora vandensis]|uniref:proline--tRNA ligase n=1 Tax=Candidatus Cyanaurora vandensis TaxID=2714958 RepID=UPI00257BE034|nr:proline--tRNA ligase [Candidatus Cyanaurora vandensis]